MLHNFSCLQKHPPSTAHQLLATQACSRASPCNRAPHPRHLWLLCHQSSAQASDLVQIALVRPPPTSWQISVHFVIFLLCLHLNLNGQQKLTQPITPFMLSSLGSPSCPGCLVSSLAIASHSNLGPNLVPSLSAAFDANSRFVTPDVYPWSQPHL